MFERCECGPRELRQKNETLLTIDCRIDKYGNYYEHEVEIERPLQKKNLHDQNMIIGDLGDTSGPVTTDEPPWLCEWISLGPREDDSGSDGEPGGLIDPSSEEGFGNANPENGVDPSDFEDDEQSVAEIAKEGLRQSSQQVPDNDASESESSSSDESHHDAETNRDPGDEDGFYGLSDIVIPSTDTEEFVEASGRLSDVLHENVKIQGPLSKGQTKRPSRFLDNIRSELIQAWLRGEDVEVWF